MYVTFELIRFIFFEIMLVRQRKGISNVTLDNRIIQTHLSTIQLLLRFLLATLQAPASLLKQQMSVQ